MAKQLNIFASLNLLSNQAGNCPSQGVGLAAEHAPSLVKEQIFYFPEC